MMTDKQARARKRLQKKKVVSQEITFFDLLPLPFLFPPSLHFPHGPRVNGRRQGAPRLAQRSTDGGGDGGGGGRALLLKTTGFQKFQYISRNRLNYDARQSPLDSERGVELKNDVFTSNHGAYDWESCRHLQLLTWLTDPPQVPARPSTDERRYLVTRKMIPNINL